MKRRQEQEKCKENCMKDMMLLIQCLNFDRYTGMLMDTKLFYLNAFLIICFCMILAFYYDEFFTGIFTIVFCLTFLIVLDNVKTKEILALTEIEITYRRKLLLLITWIYSFLFLAICINDKLLLIVSILFFILGIIIVIYYQQKNKKKKENSKQIQGLLKQKSDWKKLGVGLIAGYSITCTVLIALACGPGLLFCAFAAFTICGSLDTTIGLSIDLSIKDIEKQMYEAGCACAIWCG